MIPVHWSVLVAISTIFGALALVVKKRGLAHEHSLEYLGVFKFFEFVIVIPLIPFINLNHSLVEYSWMYILSIFITAGLFYQAKGFKHLQFSKALPLFHLKTVVTLFAAMFFLGEILSLKDFIGVFVVLTALYFVEAEQSFNSLIKKFFSSNGFRSFIIACLILGVTIVFEKRIVLNVGVLSYLFIMYAFSVLNTLIALTIFYNGYNDILHGIRKEGTIIFEASLYSTLSNIFFLASLSGAFVVVAEALRKSSSILAMIFGRTYFHEKHFEKRLFWTIVAVVGAVITVL
ncbi:EamA family transporter [Candidatus Woesearchaeota archaeon]|nr:EamA family transporter [Candidatus Woesearchaeota archaeon]